MCVTMVHVLSKHVLVFLETQIWKCWAKVLKVLNHDTWRGEICMQSTQILLLSVTKRIGTGIKSSKFKFINMVF